MVTTMPPWNPFGAPSSSKGEIAAREGIEFATALAYDRVLREARNKAFFDVLARSGAERIDPEVLFVIVPGALYRVHQHSGAVARYAWERMLR